MPDDEIRAAMADPCTSYTLKDQLEIALDRDPVDALSDAELLVRLLKARLESDPDFVAGADR